MQTADGPTDIRYGDPFLRWRIDPSAVGEEHRHGDGVLIELTRDRHGRPVEAPHLLGLGPAHDLAALLQMAGARMTEVPQHINIERHASDLLPPSWQWDHPWTWDWMWTTGAPAPQPGEESVVELDRDAADVTEIEGLLETANPGSHGRPSSEDGQRWLGVRDAEGTLVAAGGMFLLPSGISHLRGITTLTRAQGRGLGTVLSARLTRIGLEDGGGVCTLGAFSDNTRALDIYRRLGFRLGHHFCSGALVR